VNDHSREMAAAAEEGVMVTTVEAVLTRADGSRVDLGVVASSHPERIPVTARREGE
jgi:hypothetical protein